MTQLAIRENWFEDLVDLRRVEIKGLPKAKAA